MTHFCCGMRKGHAPRPLPICAYDCYRTQVVWTFSCICLATEHRSSASKLLSNSLERYFVFRYVTDENVVSTHHVDPNIAVISATVFAVWDNAFDCTH